MKTLDRRAAEIFRSMLALRTTKIDNSDGTYNDGTAIGGELRTDEPNRSRG